MAFLTKSDILIGVGDAGDGIPEFRTCALLHVATIEPIGSAAPGSAQP
jgi:hypothetical protein